MNKPMSSLKCGGYGWEKVWATPPTGTPPRNIFSHPGSPPSGVSSTALELPCCSPPNRGGASQAGGPKGSANARGKERPPPCPP